MVTFGHYKKSCIFLRFKMLLSTLAKVISPHLDKCREIFCNTFATLISMGRRTFNHAYRCVYIPLTYKRGEIRLKPIDVCLVIHTYSVGNEYVNYFLINFARSLILLLIIIFFLLWFFLIWDSNRWLTFGIVWRWILYFNWSIMV